MRNRNDEIFWVGQVNLVHEIFRHHVIGAFNPDTPQAKAHVLRQGTGVSDRAQVRLLAAFNQVGAFQHSILIDPSADIDHTGGVRLEDVGDRVAVNDCV